MTLRDLDRFLIAAYFLAGPLLWAVTWSTGEPALWCTAATWRTLLIFALASPLVGALFALRHPRARFAVYIFCTMAVLRAALAHHPLGAALPIAVVAYLQTPRMRRLYPSIASRLSRRG